MSLLLQDVTPNVRISSSAIKDDAGKMNIIEKKVGSVNIVCPIGRLDTYSSPEVEQKIIPLTETAQIALVINMEKMEYISSSGLRIMLSGLKKAKKGAGDLRLTCLQPYVKEVFDMAGFSQLFRIFDNEDDAINSFK